MNRMLTVVPLDVAVADIRAAFTTVHSTLKNSHGACFADAFIMEHRNAMLEAFLINDLVQQKNTLQPA